jgi:hypothetical protein
LYTIYIATSRFKLLRLTGSEELSDGNRLMKLPAVHLPADGIEVSSCDGHFQLFSLKQTRNAKLAATRHNKKGIITEAQNGKPHVIEHLVEVVAFCIVVVPHHVTTPQIGY